MPELANIGRNWLADQIDAMDDKIKRMTPVNFNEENRYIPQGVSPRPGYMRFDLFPYCREIVDCFDINSQVREVNLMKGVQTSYTTMLESILLYWMVHIKTKSVMFVTADGDLAKGRVDNNILPMINESGFGDLIRSSDEGNSRKTGKTKNYLQWEGGGFLIYNGARNGAKMRQYSVPLLLKDELDGWQRVVGKDANTDKTTDARCAAYWGQRKIFRGSTPLLEPSMIKEAYDKGDQRKYLVRCKSCSYPQAIKQEHINKETGEVNGFKWETENGILILESVRYCCKNCGHAHYEHDKEKLFSEKEGAHWHPTATPKEPGIRSYHLPAWYSPFGFTPWYKGIAGYLEAYDPKAKQVKDISKYQEYYNNTLGVPFKSLGSKLRFESVSAHRRTTYKYGQIPNDHAIKYSGSPILMLKCQVDVHKSFLAVSVFGICRELRTYLIDYFIFEDEDCTELNSKVWQQLRELIEEKRYTAADGKTYGMATTLIDAGYSNDTVVKFCSDYGSGVYPILGRQRAGKHNTIKEFAEFTTTAGTIGYKITVDHYKDRMATVLRRDWQEVTGVQSAYHFNAPVDITDKHLKELTVEYRQKKSDPQGNEFYIWHRPGNARNELWDLLGYCHASVEIFAYSICILHFEMKTIDWQEFWDFAENPDNDELFNRTSPAEANI